MALASPHAEVKGLEAGAVKVLGTLVDIRMAESTGIEVG